ncbi:MCR_0457 family protein [Acinetobacter guillouiae]|uniref:MCR_0457 family protein n=1 Tax=Acinetobacter guillouiae TaxID=106649 RepID=UPI003AF5AD32
MITRSLTRTISIAFITLCAQSAFSETLTSQESDRIVKEDIAATQVLAEVCPALIGNNPAFQTKIGSLTQTLLKDLSKPTTLTQLQQDPEYQTVLKEAQTSAKEVDQAEHKAVCADVLELPH